MLQEIKRKEKHLRGLLVSIPTKAWLPKARTLAGAVRRMDEKVVILRHSKHEGKGLYDIHNYYA